jgi:hypothetical protein
MNKKKVAIILEIIPIIAVVINFALIFLPINAGNISWLTSTTTILAFLGFVFFFIARALAKGEKTVKILGIFDWLATVGIIALYVLAIFSFGL